MELRSHSSDGARHATPALARARSCTHVKARGGEVAPVGEGLVPLRGRWEAHVDAHGVNASKELEGVARWEVGYVGFGLYVLEVYAGVSDGSLCGANCISETTH